MLASIAEVRRRKTIVKGKANFTPIVAPSTQLRRSVVRSLSSARVRTGTLGSAVAALLGTRRVVLPNSVLNFTHCRIVLIAQPIFLFSGNLYLSLAKGICFFGKRYMFSTSICRKTCAGFTRQKSDICSPTFGFLVRKMSDVPTMVPLSLNSPLSKSVTSASFISSHSRKWAHFWSLANFQC